ncbi:CD209 antigen-like protein E isoform X7 [Larimichthys crocea]|uniref:CD209 antigen-like protein E isoform X8 n=1 Tax=Larimichthys crocea TaxID=215358 RepID=UPI000900CF0D|nr:CD209 antigen-like protein E isoform X8 [Larimichthys crocea]XP_027138585.1 CD209 antigen-like protein E isoform X7 [Larimichthys crocea]
MFNEDESKITIEIRDLPVASSRRTLKSYTSEYDEVATAVPDTGRKLERCVAVSFCLLCILQAALNISLRLAVSSQQKSLDEERDELKRQLNLTNHYLNQGWVYFGSSFYYISSVNKAWQDSREDCLQRGADLVIINSEAEQKFIRQYPKYIWIGLTDRETEGVWKWVDGTPLTTSFWRSGEPNNYRGGNEDCVELTLDWNDVECEQKKLWMCEKKMAL